MSATRVNFHVVKKMCKGILADCVEAIRVSDTLIFYEFPEDLWPPAKRAELAEVKIIQTASKTM